MAGSEVLKSKIQHEITELTSAINGIIETFRKMKSPLVETHEKVPQATVQLDKISEQTEAAAHQMLDRVEQITQREGDVIQGLEKLKEAADKEQLSNISAAVGEIIAKANDNLDDAYMIMDALQFQDITAQQMNHAASLLEDIEGRLNVILSTLNGDDSGDGEGVQGKVRVYDPHADLFDKKTDQSAVDSIFDKAKQQ
jgi:chemotaxis regulatin CheY-phosphate phosphatase CheZ